jgi:hypothetical protein
MIDEIGPNPMSHFSVTTAPESPRRPSTLRRIVTYALGAALSVGILWWVGRGTWSAYQEYRLASREAEEGVPVGYVGVSLRRTYNDKPPRFFDTTGSRKRLWAAKGVDGQPEFYDVTDAAFAVDNVSGGYGRDSIPGIDYPLFERLDSPRARRFRDQHEIWGLTLPDVARAYPRDLLRKIEVVNDEGGVPFAIVFDRQHDVARFYDRRVDGRPVTFGTTGYALGDSDDPQSGRPLLYDRRTKSLWLPEEKALVCVNGPLKGTRLPAALRPEPTTWGAWVAGHPQTVVLVGSDRDDDRKPIPAE